MRRRLALLLALGFAATAPAFAAGFPAAYAPTVVLPTALAEQRFEFDLSAPLARAAREHKRLYVYLGASDCPFCRKYEAFLTTHAGELVPEFAKDYLVVDLRSLEEAPVSPFAGAHRLDVEHVAEIAAQPCGGRRIVLCCRSGQRALLAADRLRDRGISNIALVALG